MNERRRVVLEGILHSDDSTPTERLRAVELLQADEDHDGEAVEFFADLDEVPDELLDEHLDATLVADAVRAVLTGEEVMGLRPESFPATAAVLQDELGRRLREQAARLEAEHAERLAQLTRDATPEPDEEQSPDRSNDAPSAPETPVRAAVIQMAEVLKRWDDSPPTSPLRRPLRPPRIGR